MAFDPFLSELMVGSFNFAPTGWAACNGQLLPINQNQALFSLLGTTYGGNGQTTFALPDLRGRVPIHFGSRIGGSTFTLGQTGGSPAHTLASAEIQDHAHAVTMRATGAAATTAAPAGNAWATPLTLKPYAATAADHDMDTAAVTIGNTGGSQAHNNVMPFLALNWTIALQGIFPSQN